MEASFDELLDRDLARGKLSFDWYDFNRGNPNYMEETRFAKKLTDAMILRGYKPTKVYERFPAVYHFEPIVDMKEPEE